MLSIRPFSGYIANPDRAREIVSPVYDALTPEQRHAYAVAHPRNYLNVMRSRDEYPEDARPSRDALLVENKACLMRMIEEGDFLYQEKAGFYIYRLAVTGHAQTGVVAEVPVAEYEQGRIKKHEHTREEKEDDLTAYQRVVRASSSPICLTYWANPRIDQFVRRLTARTPIVHFTADDGVVQSLWLVSDDEEIETLTRLFREVPAAYLTDGHHRAASAARFVAAERMASANHTGTEPYNFLLVACFPHDELRILEYSRRVKGLNGHTAATLLEAIAEHFHVLPLNIDDPEEARPTRRGDFAMFLNGSWYRLSIRPERVADHGPAGALDVSLLQEYLLGPILGIADPRTDGRMSYLSGAFSLSDLEHYCAESNEVGFAVFPISIEELMAVADHGEAMPPKSTWFDPKLRSGLFLRLR